MKSDNSLHELQVAESKYKHLKATAEETYFHGCQYRQQLRQTALRKKNKKTLECTKHTQENFKIACAEINCHLQAANVCR